jgi:peptidylprolyl isomerase
MNPLIPLLVLAQAQAGHYAPTGPQVEFTMANGRTFVVATDPKASPKTVARIVELVGSGFYNRQRVHRVEDWVVQWGAPESRTLPFYVDGPEGRVVNPRIAGGGSGKGLPFEMSDVDYSRGVVGVASTGLQVGGDSQLFVLKRDALRLWRSYAVVGKVVQGMDTVGTIQRGDRIRHARLLTTTASGSR